jgi:hypothetical protein
MPRRDDYYDDDEDEREVRRRHRPRRRYEEEYEEDDYDDEPSSGGKIIPYKNGLALAAYYGGFISVIFVLAALATGIAVLVDMLSKTWNAVAIGVAVLGILLGPLAMILGFLGMRYARTHPRAQGGGHAITGMIIGLLSALVGVLLLGGLILAATNKNW